MLDRKNIIFDLGGVLLDIVPEATLDALRNLGVGEHLLTDGLNVRNELLQGLECGIVSPEEMYCAIAESMGVVCSPAVRERIKAAWCAMLGEAAIEKFRCLRALRKRGYKVFLLSNTNVIHWEAIEKKLRAIEGRQLTDYFDRVYLSFEMHACKPDDEIFKKLLVAEGINAEDCLFLDDSRDNCATAASLGIASLLMERNAPLPQWLIE
ncbi:MAG: HAD family phosphatase [Bacteroidales bacterium]|nr:HAD family phosphatase [Bacteroidales bacterium]